MWFSSDRIVTPNRRHFFDGRFTMRHAFLSGVTLLLLAIAGCTSSATPHATTPHATTATSQGASVLLVCNGSTARCPALPSSAGPYYRTVQEAVDAARSGDWILIYPGVYHEKSSRWPTAGVWIGTPDLHIRGLDRNKVVIDGSDGPASQPCPASPKLQDTNGGVGRDGIV